MKMSTADLTRTYGWPEQLKTSPLPFRVAIKHKMRNIARSAGVIDTPIMWNPNSKSHIIGIISDIHARLDVLLSVLNILEDLEIDKVICLGDIVDRGPSPIRCIKVLRSRSILTLKGNHEVAFFEPELLDEWAQTEDHLQTAARISQDDLEYLENLPENHHEENALFVHANPIDHVGRQANSKIDRFFLTHDSQAEVFSAMENFSLCFVGHDHFPATYALRKNGEIDIFNPEHPWDFKFGQWSGIKKYEKVIHCVGTLRLLGAYNSKSVTFSLFDPKKEQLMHCQASF